MYYTFMAIIVAFCLVLMFLGAYRFFTLRSNGNNVTLRRLPAVGNHGWRNGILRYESNNELKFYQFRSLSPFPDVIFHRSHLTLDGQRDYTEEEASFLFDGTPIVKFQHEGKDYEVQMSKHATMAFVSWIESAPNTRLDKMSPSVARRRMWHI